VESRDSRGKIISYVILATPAMSHLRKKRKRISEDTWGPKSQDNSSQVELMSNINTHNIDEQDAILLFAKTHQQKVTAVQDLICETPNIAPKKVNHNGSYNAQSKALRCDIYSGVRHLSSDCPNRYTDECQNR
jgi:hypothetical protein